MRTSLRGVLGLAAAALVSACSSTEPATTSRLVVRLADAPSDQIASAKVWISSVYVIPGTDPAGARQEIATFSPAQEFDLMTLQNGVTAELGSATVSPGDYSQLRLVVDRAEVTLKSPLTFSGGSPTIQLTTPSAQQSGIKVNFDAPVHMASGETVLVVDFDVSRNFIFTGPASSPNGMLFKPVLHATATDIASSISGTVGPDAARATAQVFAIVPVGCALPATPCDTVASATVSPTDGTYTLRYLDPRVAPFIVSASATGYTSQQQTVPMPLTDRPNIITGINFTLTP